MGNLYFTKKPGLDFPAIDHLRRGSMSFIHHRCRFHARVLTDWDLTCQHQDEARMSEIKLPLLFGEYQRLLLDEGMAISADCSHPSYGNIVYSETEANTSSSLSTWAREKTLDVLQDRYRRFNFEFQNSREPNMKESDYSSLLIKDFNEEKICSPKLLWAEPNNPWSGVICRAKGNIWNYFEIKVSLPKMKTAWENRLHLNIDTKAKSKITTGIDDFIDELGEEPFVPDRLQDSNWESMYNFGEVVNIYSDLSEKFKKNALAYKKNILDPVLDNYSSAELHIASPDSTYFTIGRPYFHLVLVGERKDGSYETTIFESLNE
jgi:hypothetical protein